MTKTEAKTWLAPIEYRHLAEIVRGPVDRSDHSDRPEFGKQLPLKLQARRCGQSARLELAMSPVSSVKNCELESRFIVRLKPTKVFGIQFFRIIDPKVSKHVRKLIETFGFS